MVLQTNYKDDILNSSMSGSRRYSMTNNSDGSVSLTDTTTYDVVGNEFTAADINTTNAAVMGFVSQKTVFSADGNTITETDSNSQKRITQFSADTDGNQVITEKLYSASGTQIGTKTTTFNTDGSIKEVAEL